MARRCWHRGERLAAELHATVEFKVPLVGGKIESYLAGQLAEGIRGNSALHHSWITEHA